MSCDVSIHLSYCFLVQPLNSDFHTLDFNLIFSFLFIGFIFFFPFYLFWVVYLFYLRLCCPLWFLCSPSAGSSIPSTHDHSAFPFYCIVCTYTCVSYCQINIRFQFQRCIVFIQLHSILILSCYSTDVSSFIQFIDIINGSCSQPISILLRIGFIHSFSPVDPVTSLIHTYTCVFLCYFNYQRLVLLYISCFGFVFHCCYYSHLYDSSLLYIQIYLSVH